MKTIPKTIFMSDEQYARACDAVEQIKARNPNAAGLTVHAFCKNAILYAIKAELRPWNEPELRPPEICPSCGSFRYMKTLCAKCKSETIETLCTKCGVILWK